MARATFVKSARKTIYQRGKMVEYVSKKGKQEGQTLTRLDKTIPFDENDLPYINKGESYYHWALFRSPTQYSKTAPKQSQLTGSEFLSSIYALSEDLAEFDCSEISEVEEKRDEFISQLEEMRDECQEKLDNMPESLQYAPSGEILQSRIDGLEEMISEFENISVEELDEFEYEDNGDDDEEEQKEIWEAERQEVIDEAIGEMQNIEYGGE